MSGSRDWKRGYCAVIAEGIDEARKTLMWYIGISDHEPASVLKAAQICLARSEMNDSPRESPSVVRGNACRSQVID
jgi:hypothetical protein